MKKAVKIVKLTKNIEKELKNKTILITGGAGSIGSALTKEILQYPIKQVRVIDIDELAYYAIKEMKKNNITQLIVNDKRNYVGIVHIHDIIKEGIIG